MLIAVALAAVLLVGGCGSSRATQARHLTGAQIHERAVSKLIQRVETQRPWTKAELRRLGLKRPQHIYRPAVQRKLLRRYRAESKGLDRQVLRFLREYAASETH